MRPKVPRGMGPRSTALLVAVGTFWGAGVPAALEAQGSTASGPLPVSERPYLLGDPVSDYGRFMMSGGPPPDGIPSIDEPRFVRAEAATLAPGDPVIGIVVNGQARAYPQAVMVYHEIVNDRVGGVNVAITYCPLTATSQGFLRGNSTLGVSGQLLNSNLVLYDRDTGSHFSQIAATGLSGPLEGRGLREVGLVWTTWERWRALHPETEVLSEQTGYLRNYSRDPYGSYNPAGGYYVEEETIFPLMHRSDRLHAKEMVVGARTAASSAYFVLSDLASARLLQTQSFVAAYEPSLHTAHVYEQPVDGRAVAAMVNGMVRIGTEEYAPEALPLVRVIPVQAFYFAWHAFYPESETP